MPRLTKIILRFTGCAIPYAREHYKPELIEEQSDGSLLVTIYEVPDSQIINLVLNGDGAVQVISPAELAEKVVEQAERVIKANMPDKTDRQIVKQGSYENLLSYKKAQIIYDATVLFCRRFLQKGDRTVDQMIQAARSGKQNIVEGAMASGVSSETELKLTGVARASLEELLEDYKDFLRVNSFPVWSKDDKAAQAVRRLGKTHNESYETYRYFFEERSAGTFANILLCLIYQCNYLLDRQIASLETAFIKSGGIKERMLQARLQERNKRK